MKNIFLFFLIGTSLFQSSCEGVIVDIEIPEHEPVLAAYCFINVDDSTVKVFVQVSQAILDSTNKRFVDNATVEIYKNGTLWQEINTKIIEASTGEIHYEKSLNQPISAEGYGDSYELRVSAPGFETVTATQIMPKPKQATGIQHLRQVTNDFGEIIDNSRITIDDAPNEENYYKITLDIFEIGTINSNDTVYEARSIGGQALANTESISNAFNGVVITDKLFDGQRFIADVGSSPSGSSHNVVDEPITYSGTLELYLMAITRAEYLYQKSLYSYSNAQANPFAEPTLIYSNMSSGLGMFSMMTMTKEAFVF